MATNEDSFEQYLRETPEPKLELIEGRLIVGNSIAGSRHCLHELLSGWGTQAALAFAEIQDWRTALSEAFAPMGPPNPLAPRTEWQTWAESVAYDPQMVPAGPMLTGPHRASQEKMKWGIHHACQLGHFGTSLGHDFVMQLGDNAFTPDGFLIGRQAMERLFERYLHGPADLVREVLLPGREPQDREVKFRAYEAGGVPHYWIIDPEAQLVHFFRLVNGQYERDAPAPDGRYRPTTFPGLAFVLDRLWNDEDPFRTRVFEVETALPGEWADVAQKGIEWEDTPFEPTPSLSPRAVLFEEFISCCPRAKFEYYDDRPIIDGRIGTRNVLGMLLRTFGLIETVGLMHPREWIAGIEAVECEQRIDAERKAQWWKLAQKAAVLLRQKRKVARIAVAGDLTRPAPLHFWSELLLAVWGLDGSTFDNFELLDEIDPDRVIDLINVERATNAEKLLLAGAVDV